MKLETFEKELMQENIERIVKNSNRAKDLICEGAEEAIKEGWTLEKFILHLKRVKFIVTDFSGKDGKKIHMLIIDEGEWEGEHLRIKN